MRRFFVIASLVSAFPLGCGSDSDPTPVIEAETGADTSVTTDTGSPAIDTSVDDTGADDTAAADSTTTDGVPADTSAADSKASDSALADAVIDTAVADTAVADTAVADTAVADTAVADTAVADTAVADTSFDAGAACNVLTQIGDLVTITRVASAPPVLTGGGPIPGGTYVLTSLVVYTGPGGATGTVGTARLTSTFTATSSTTYYGHGLSTDVTPTAATQRSTTNTTVSGINFTQTWLCRDPLPLIGPLSGTYELSGTTLKLLYTASNALYTLEKK